ncbi:glycine-rich protein [Psychroserpens jangbogonensis]|uniref:glycine-rich protein n=1 Tax=Psychroserpens jangbogonensis TaxID=1484460 RepID=UPI00068FA9AA|nr:glycine-rich protein [Psychroserpens jangbogonensis]
MRKIHLLLTTLLVSFFCSINSFAQNWSEIINTYASDGVVGDDFGFSVAIDGDRAIVGKCFPNGSYIFKRVGLTWVEEVKLPHPIFSDCSAVAIDGNTAVVGTLDRAYIYAFDGTNWAVEQQVSAPGNLYFGNSVAISGNTIVVGARYDDQAAVNAGAAYIFERISNVWVEVFSLENQTGTINAETGNSVAIDGDIAVIGSHKDIAPNGASSGTAYVLKRTGGVWAIDTTLSRPNGTNQNQFGSSVAISGSTIIIGAPANFQVDGATYIYKNNGTTWLQEAELVAINPSQFGCYVDISGDIAVVGTGLSNKSRYVYQRDGTTWSQSIVLSSSLVDFSFGIGDVGISNTSIILSNIGDFNTGSIAFFEMDITPDLATLPDINQDCEVDTSPNAPTANNGSIIGIADVSFPFNVQGTTVMTWAYGSGYHTQTQNLIIDDISAPIPDLATLPDVTGVCEVTNLTPPTATDNCGGSVIVTSDAVLPITIEGTTIVNWTYDDGNGNTTTQTQNIILDRLSSLSCTNITTPNDPGLCEADLFIAPPTISESCSTVSTGLSFAGGFLSRVSVPNFPFQLNFTLEAWVNPIISAADGYKSVISRGAVFENNTNYAFGFRNRTVSNEIRLFFTIRNGSTIQNFEAILPSNPTGTWNHMAASFDSVTKEVMIYWNGALLDSTVFTLNPTNGGQDLILGQPSSFTSTDGAYVGQMDEVRIWDRALPATEIASSYNRALVGTEPGLLAYYKMEDGSPSTITTDSSANGYTGALGLVTFGGPTWISSQAPVSSIALTNTITNTSDASGLYPVGDTTVTWTATDAQGNTATCDVTVTVEDNEMPIPDLANLPDITAQCEVNSLTAPTANNGAITATADVTLPITSQGTTVVTWSYDSPNCDAVTQTQAIIIEDTVTPTIICPTDITVNNTLEECGAVVIYDLPVATDNCSTTANTFVSQFIFTGAAETFIVPAGVTEVIIDAFGAEGGSPVVAPNWGGLGGRATGILTVTPGETLYVYVGEFIANSNNNGQGFPRAFNGGGIAGQYPDNNDYERNSGAGGGASDVRQGGTSLYDRVIVAGGGGGGGIYSYGGDGGGTHGQDGYPNSGGIYSDVLFAGKGGLDWAGGMGGKDNTNDLLYNPHGTFGVGGDGIALYSASAHGGGSGGGGYYGGGGGNARASDADLYQQSFGGGGGSSYIDGLTNASTSSGVHAGYGFVTISWTTPAIFTLELSQTTGLASGEIFPVGTTTNTFVAIDGAGNTTTCSFDVTVNVTIATQQLSWNGSVSTDWEDSDNWTPNAIPSECAEITIPITANPPLITGIKTVKDINISSGSSMTVPVGATLNVSGDVNMYSVSNSYSGLVVDGTIAIGGEAKYHRYTNAQSNGNDLIAPPLSGQSWSSFLTNDANYNEGLIFNNGVQPLTTYLFGPYEKENTDDYVLYNDNSDAQLVSGKGYRTATNTANGEALIFTGTIETGPVNAVITNEFTGHEPEWNLIGNPYPAYLDVSTFLNHVGSVSGVSNLSLLNVPTAAIYGYNASTAGTGNIWTIANLATGTTLLPPGQGFFVSSNLATATLEFSPDMQVVGNADDFILGRQAQPNDFIKLRMDTASNNVSTSIYFHDNASSGLDLGYDAAVFGGQVPEFGLYSHLVQDNVGIPMAIQTLYTSAITDVTIPLGVHVNQGEQVTISLEDYILDPSVDVYLEDNATNTFTLLNSSNYTFTSNEAISGTGRFFLNFTTGTLTLGEINLNTVNMYTNQTDRTIVIEGVLLGETKASVYDLLGRTVLQQELDPAVTKQIMNADKLSSGVYLVQLQNGSQQLTQKVILK